MTFFKKPKNKWGWIRLSSSIILVGVALWAALIFGLQNSSEFSVMAERMSLTFSQTNVLAVGIFALILCIFAEWMEEESLRISAKRSKYQEIKLSADEKRGKILGNFREVVQTVLAEVEGEPPQDHAQAWKKISELVRSSLTDLDATGKGDLLRTLESYGLLSREKIVLDLHSADFSKSQLNGVQFNDISLEGVDLSRAQLYESHLACMQFSGANLNKADLRNSDLKEAIMVGCNLSSAIFENANLEHADLRDCRMDKAVLIKANLKNCKLDGLQGRNINLYEADLRGSQGISQTILDHAVLLDTILPDGRKVTNAKGKEYKRKIELLIAIERF